MSSNQFPPNYNFSIDDLRWVPKFMKEIKDYFFVRPEDNLLILRPNKVMHLNTTARTMLQLLMNNMTPEDVVEHLTSEFKVESQQVLNDLAIFVDDLRNIVSGNQNIYTYQTARILPFGVGDIKYPVLPPTSRPRTGVHLLNRPACQKLQSGLQFVKVADPPLI